MLYLVVLISCIYMLYSYIVFMFCKGLISASSTYLHRETISGFLILMLLLYIHMFGCVHTLYSYVFSAVCMSS